MSIADLDRTEVGRLLHTLVSFFCLVLSGWEETSVSIAEVCPQRICWVVYFPPICQWLGGDLVSIADMDGTGVGCEYWYECL